jgi:hypothetical protein
LTVPGEPDDSEPDDRRRRSFAVTLAALMLVAGGLTATVAAVVGRPGGDDEHARHTSESQPASQASEGAVSDRAASASASPAPASSSPDRRSTDRRQVRQIYGVCSADRATVEFEGRLELGLTRWSYAIDGHPRQALTSSSPRGVEIVQSCGAGRLDLIRLRRDLVTGVQRRLGARTLDIVCSSGRHKALDTLPIGSDFACSVSAAKGEAVVVPGTITASDPHFRLSWPTGREATVLGPAWPGTLISVDLQQTHRRDVVMIQRRLNELGYGPLAVDGYYGVQTEGAVIAFQTDRGLEVDGVVGPYTWAALFQ